MVKLASRRAPAAPSRRSDKQPAPPAGRPAKERSWPAGSSPAYGKLPHDRELAAETFGEMDRKPPATAGEIASLAASLVSGERDRQHGAKHDNFSRIATMWDAWLKIRRDPAAPVGAHDVGCMMALMKLARTQSGAHNSDDYVDCAGYAACAGEVAAAG